MTADKKVIDGTERDASTGFGEKKYTLQKLINYLNTQKIDRMKSEFESGVNEELTLVEFVKTGLRNFQVEEVDELEFVECLCEFFSEVDTEQTGRISFSAFTDFVIGFAMPESLGQGFDAVAPPRFERITDEDANCHHDGIEFVKWSQSMNAVMTCERGFCGVRLWTPTLLPQRQAHPLVWSKLEDKLVCNLVPIKEDDRAVGAHALACDFDPVNRMVGCALSTSRLCWWDQLHRCSHSESCDLLQTGIWYSSTLNQWLSSGTDGVVRLWQPRSVYDGCAKGRLIGHQDKVTTMVDVKNAGIPNTIATGSLDKVVLLWDAHTLSQTAKIVDFKQGVRDLDFHDEYKVICAGGLELCGRILTPQPTSLHATIATLAPHSSPLIACRAIPNSPAVVTADELNFIRLWDLRKTSSPYQVISPETLTHDFDLLCVVRAQEASGDRHGLILAGGTMQGFKGPQIDPGRSKRRTPAVDHSDAGRFVSCALKLPQLIVVVMSLEVQVWSASTGRLVRRLRGEKIVGEYEEISAFCFDSRQACFFLGYDRGALRHYSFRTGLPTNPAQLTRHEAPVTHVQYIPAPQYLVVSASADGVVQIHRGDADYALIRILRPKHFDARISTFSGSQLSLFLGGQSLSFWDIELGKCKASAQTGELEPDPQAELTIADLNNQPEPAELTAAAFVGQLPAVATVDEQQRLEIWSIEPAKCVARVQHTRHVTVNQVVPFVQWPEAAQASWQPPEDLKFLAEAQKAMRLSHPSSAWLRHKKFSEKLEQIKARAVAHKEETASRFLEVIHEEADDDVLEQLREELLELTQEAMLLQFRAFWNDVGEDATEAFGDLRQQLNMQLNESLRQQVGTESTGTEASEPKAPARNERHSAKRSSMSLMGSPKRIQQLDRSLFFSHPYDRSNASDSPRDTPRRDDRVKSGIPSSPELRKDRGDSTAKSRGDSGADSADFQLPLENSVGASAGLPLVWIIIGDSDGFVTVFDVSAILISARLHERPTPAEKLNLTFKKMSLPTPECPEDMDEEDLPEPLKLHSWRAHRKAITFSSPAPGFNGLITLSEDWTVRLWSLGAIDEIGTLWGTLDLRRLESVGDWSPPEVLANSSLHLVQGHRVMVALHGEAGCIQKESTLRQECLEQIRLGHLMQECSCENQERQEPEAQRDKGHRASVSKEKGLMHRGKRLGEPIAGNLVEAMASANEHLTTPKSLQTRTIQAELTHQPPLPTTSTYTGASRRLETCLDKIEREYDQTRHQEGKRRCYSPRPKPDHHHSPLGNAMLARTKVRQTLVASSLVVKPGLPTKKERRLRLSFRSKNGCQRYPVAKDETGMHACHEMLARVCANCGQERRRVPEYVYQVAGKHGSSKCGTEIWRR